MGYGARFVCPVIFPLFDVTRAPGHSVIIRPYLCAGFVIDRHPVAGQCPVIEFLKAYFSLLFIKFTYEENFPGFPVIACTLAHRPIFVILLHTDRLAGVCIIFGGFAPRSIGIAYLYAGHFAGRGIIVRSRLDAILIVDCRPVECQRVTAEFLIVYHPLLLVKFLHTDHLTGVCIIFGELAQRSIGIAYLYPGHFVGCGVVARPRLDAILIVDCRPVEGQYPVLIALTVYHPLLLVKFPHKGRLAGVRIIFGGFAQRPGFVILPNAGNFSGRGIILGGLPQNAVGIIHINS